MAPIYLIYDFKKQSFSFLPLRTPHKSNEQPELLSFIITTIVVIVITDGVAVNAIKYIIRNTWHSVPSPFPPLISHLFMGCDLQCGACFVCSGKTNDWLRVRLAELALDCNRCWAAFCNESRFFSDPAGDRVAEADEEPVLGLPKDGVDCGTACG